MKYKYKIVVDSASDLTNDFLVDKSIGFEVAPLTIHVKDREFIDDETIDTVTLLKEVNEYSGKSTSSCPSPGAYLEAFKGAEHVFCVTISAKLSGSFNSASVAAETAQSQGQKAFVIDSKLVSGAEILIIEHLVELIHAGKSFDEICDLITEFTKDRHLLFVLNKFDNLIKNGRVSKLQGILASLLKIKPISAGQDGEIKILEKKRTLTQALKRTIEIIGEKINDFARRDLIISHCQHEEEANRVAEEIKQIYDFRSVRVIPMRGLCSFYALEQGIIICF